MLYTVLSLYGYLILFLLGYYYVFSKAETLLPCPSRKGLWIVPCLLGLCIRLVLAAYTEGYSTDISCWQFWSSRMAEVGPWGFYSDTYFCDYPPGYLYILWPLGLLLKALPAAMEGLLLKLPAILFDTLLCGLLYKKAQEMTQNTRLAFVISLFYALCPAVIINSAVWGQVDAVFTFFLVLSLLDLVAEKYPRSAVFFAISVAIKPQALLLSPIFLLTIWQKRTMPGFSRQLGLSVLSFLGTFLLLVLPFTIGRSPLYIMELYIKTLSSYPYASLNAFNLFTLLGANGVSTSAIFCGFPYAVWGTIGIVIAISLSGYVFYKGKDNSRFFYAAALLICGIFMLGVKMHERYLFPTIAFLFFAYVYRRDKRIIALGGGLSLLHFINVAYIFILSRAGTFYALSPDGVASLLSALHLLAYVYMVYLGLSLYAGLPKPSFLREEKSAHLSKRDKWIVLSVTILYALLAFSNLGNTAAPETAAPLVSLADFGEKRAISSASVYKGIGDCRISFSFSNDGETFGSPIIFDGSPCFKWENYFFTVEARYARVQLTGKADAVYEAAFWDENGAMIPLSSESALFDEQHLAEKENLYQNSTYFDEIYHARSAYEHIEYIPHYETTHPPLGKLIIGLGIRLFGMHPFGWRFMGTLFGVLMLPLMYIFAKRLFKSTFLSTAAMLLMTFDFMHFSQTRMATIDSYPVFFILCMYFFMYLFYEKAETLPLNKVLLYLGLSGVSFGLAIASKWIGFYGGAGLALLFFPALFRRVKQKNMKELLICLPCILFFVVIPFIIYYISYIPIHVADGAENYWQNFWNYQKHMFSYHKNLEADHPFGSMWYTWPIVGRPIWYYGNPALRDKGLVSSIVGMGNPLIWWASAAAMLFILGAAVYGMFRKKHDRRPLFLGLSFLSQLVPWMFVTRVVFIYHYFASLPFAILGLVYGFEKLCENYVFGKRAVCIFLTLCALLFLAFYPVLSGAAVPRNYVLSCLTWFESWILGY